MRSKQWYKKLLTLQMLSVKVGDEGKAINLEHSCNIPAITLTS